MVEISFVLYRIPFNLRPYTHYLPVAKSNRSIFWFAAPCISGKFCFIDANTPGIASFPNTQAAFYYF